MLKALAVMLLTAANGAFANEQVENDDTQTNKPEENTDVIADDFNFLDNSNKSISIPSDLLSELI